MFDSRFFSWAGLLDARGHVALLPLLREVLQVLLVPLGGDDLHVEQHPGVVDAAEFGALAQEGALTVGGHLEGVGVARDDVLLHQERHHPEGVDDVTRGQHEADPLALGQPQGGARVVGLRVPGTGDAAVVDTAGVGREGLLVAVRDRVEFRRRLGVTRGTLDVLDVVEAPAPLEADHVHRDVRLLLELQQLGLVAGGEVEEHRDDDEGDHRVQRLDGHVVPGLRRYLDLGAAAPVEESTPQDQAPHQHADGERGRPGPLPQGEDPGSLFRRGGGHAKAGEVLPCATGGGRQDQARGQCLQQLPLHRAPRLGGTAHAFQAVGEVGAVGTHVAPSRESRPRCSAAAWPSRWSVAALRRAGVWMFMRTKP
ncbi:hypothetical protein STENM223S_01814 [Streptomyces tendae]